MKNIELLDEDQITELEGPNLLIYRSMCLDPRNVYTLVYRWDYDDRIEMIYQHQVLTKDLKDTEDTMKELLESTLSQMLACVEYDF